VSEAGEAALKSKGGDDLLPLSDDVVVVFMTVDLGVTVLFSTVTALSPS
jgi:hypothetical protein